MNRLSKLLAMLLALAMLLSPCLAEDTAAAEEPVILSINGTVVTAAQIQYYAYLLQQNGYTESASDYAMAVDMLINTNLISEEIHNLGFDVFTDEELEAFRIEAQTEWDAAIQNYVDYYLTEDTEEARAKAAQDAEAYYTGYGYSVDVLFEDLKNSASSGKMEAYIFEGMDFEPTEEEIKSVFEQYAMKDAEYYSDVVMYEYYCVYSGYETWYRPEGYRAVNHILLTVDDELLNAYIDRLNALEEEPAEGETSVTQAEIDAAKAAILASKQGVIDEIYARLANGEKFEDLIAVYGEDPGMTDPETLAAGYEVHRESLIWDPAFTEGAFSDKMVKPGDVSDPVVGSYGIHILHYINDVKGGIVDMTDDIRNEVSDYLRSTRQSEVYEAYVNELIAKADIYRDDEAIAAIGQ